MANGTVLEWWLLIVSLLGLVLGGIAFGSAVTRLVWHYRTGHNGAARLIAWQQTITGLLVVAGVFALVILSGLLVMAPATDVPPAGALEAWARLTLLAWTTPLLLIIVHCLLAIAIWKFMTNWILDRYFEREVDVWTPGHHPGRRRDDPPAPEKGLH